MRIRSLLLTFAAALLLAPGPARVLHAQTAAPSASTSAGATTTGSARVIVKYRADSPLARRSILHATREDVVAELSARAQALGQRVGVTLATGRAITERSHVVIADGVSSPELAAKIAAQPDVEYAVPDQRRRRAEIPTDPLYHTAALSPPANPTSGGPLVGQWYLKPPVTTAPSPRTADSSAPSSINAQQAWDVTTGSASIVVAVIDTGIRFDHKDFKCVSAGSSCPTSGGNILAGYDMISDSSTANDGNGRDADASDPGDFVTSQDVTNNVPGCTQNDVGNSSWHGTETAGLIGAQTNNALGIASVGHGNVRVLPVRVLGKCGGLDSDIVAGMLWAAGVDVPGVPHNATPARVLNMSLGGSGTCDAAGGAQPYVDAMTQITAAGSVVVAAAGNSTGHAVGIPANCPGVIGVAGLRHIGTKVGFSDLGPEISIAAPGGNCINTNPGTECVYPIVTTTNSGTTTPVSDAGGGSIYSDSFARPSLGTSFSAPLVAGTAALILSVQPQLHPDEVRFKLQHSAQAFPHPSTDESGNALPVCTAPNGIDQLQCVCTTALCGAGMLDAYHAVLEANGAQARITVLTASPTANSAVQFSAANSLVGPSGAAITNYQWTLGDGGGIVTFLAPPTSGASATTVSATPTAGGTFSVTLTVTDANGIVSAESASVTVADSSASVPSGGGGGGGGGGALGAVWLGMLLAAVLALSALSRRGA